MLTKKTLSDITANGINMSLKWWRIYILLFSSNMIFFLLVYKKIDKNQNFSALGIIE